MIQHLCTCQRQAPPTPAQAVGGGWLRKIVPRVGAFVKHKKALCMPAVCLTIFGDSLYYLEKKI